LALLKSIKEREEALLIHEKRIVELEQLLSTPKANLCYCKNCQQEKYIELHDDDNTVINLGRCPYRIDFAQERYLSDYYSQYQNHMLPNGVPLNRDAIWIKQGISYIQLYRNKDDDQKRRDAENKAKSRK
jgi:hypothetical protein